MSASIPAGGLLTPGYNPWTANVSELSTNAQGEHANRNSDHPEISGDGQWVAFASEASNLVPNDTNDASDIFIKHVPSGAISRVSVASDGSQADGNSVWPSISRDGRVVVFSSGAENLGSPPSTSLQVFLHDRSTGQTRCVSDKLGPETCSGIVSADGQHVLMERQGKFQERDLFVYDVSSGQTVQVNYGPQGERVADGLNSGAISADGRCVAFNATADPTRENAPSAIYVRDLVAGTTERLTPPTARAYSPSISDDGSVVAFSSCDELVPGVAVQHFSTQVYVHDRASHQTTCATADRSGTDCYNPRLSGNGRFIVFDSRASQSWIHDRQTQQTALLDDSSVVTQVQEQPHTSVSGDGKTVVFEASHGTPDQDLRRTINVVPNVLDAEWKDAALRREAERLSQEPAPDKASPGHVEVEPDHVIIDGVRVPRRTGM